jgi:superfamily II DNA/RNA helicase
VTSLCYLSACLHFRCLHGDVFQNERNEIISAFKKQEFPILVATDVAARGLDIPHIRNVVNFDVARWVVIVYGVIIIPPVLQRHRHSHS